MVGGKPGMNGFLEEKWGGGECFKKGVANNKKMKKDED